LVDFYEEDTLKEETTHLAPKLKSEHAPFSKMRVDLAAQVNYKIPYFSYF